MATVTIYSSSSDGYIMSEDSATPGVYADARAGTNNTTFTAYSSSTYITVGQNYFTGSYSTTTYDCYEGFISFDTSVLASAHLITAVTLALRGYNNGSTTDFEVEARIHDWGASLTTADYVAGASLSGKTKVATVNSSGYSSSYMNFTSESGFASNLNLTGTTYIVLCSKEQTDNSAPTNGEYVGFYDQEYNPNSYTPKITVTYTDPVIKKIAGVPKMAIKKVQQLA